MRQAAKPTGMLAVLDYNHARNKWEPEPPAEFSHFYGAFLAWRQANRWDNEIADHLPQLFRSAGLVDIQCHVQDEVVQHGEPEFAERRTLWSQVIENVGEQIAQAGFCRKSQLREAQERYDSWVMTDLVRQTLTMRVVTHKTLAPTEQILQGPQPRSWRRSTWSTSTQQAALL